MATLDLTKGFCLCIDWDRNRWRRFKKHELISGLCKNIDGKEYYVVFKAGLLFVRVEMVMFVRDNLGPIRHLPGFDSLEAAHFDVKDTDRVYRVSGGTVTLLEELERAGIFEAVEREGGL